MLQQAGAVWLLCQGVFACEVCHCRVTVLLVSGHKLLALGSIYSRINRIMHPKQLMWRVPLQHAGDNNPNHGRQLSLSMRGGNTI